jgi:hypothetical protein
VTTTFDTSVSAASLARVTQLAIVASGDETYAINEPLTRAIDRTERFVYRPLFDTRRLMLSVAAEDAAGVEIAKGSSAEIQLVANQTTQLQITLYGSIPVDGGSDGPTMTDGGSADLLQTDAGGDGGPLSLFDDEFNADDLQAAWTLGPDSWSISGGVAQSTDTTSTDDDNYMYATATTALTDYEAVARMRQDPASPSGGAFEIMTRVVPGTAVSMYRCDWNPDSGELLIQSKTPTGGIGSLASSVFTPGTGYTPQTWLTMHFVVHGSTLQCSIDEIPNATLTATDTQIANGAAGLKAFEMMGDYDYFRVFAVP